MNFWLPNQPRKEREEEMDNSVELVEVSFEGLKVGRLALAPDGRCLFEYYRNWLDQGFSISPFYLPLQSGVFTAKADPFEGLFGVFADSLPDGWGHLLIDRWLREKGIEPRSLTILNRLALVGENGMGALTYSPIRLRYNETPVQSLDYYAEESWKLMHQDSDVSLEELVDKAGSSGGVRPKILINIDGKEWLIKFRASVDPHDIGAIEYKYSLLAGKCGIEMPETRLFEGKYFGAVRFDRTYNSKLHVHSAAGLLYASHRLPSLDYISLLKATQSLTRDINEVGKMFRLMVFNVIIGNRDDHSKNFSFIYQNGKWQVAPGYDLLPSYGFNGNHTTTINGKGKATIDDCMDVASMVSFPTKRAKKIIQEVQDGVISIIE